MNGLCNMRDATRADKAPENYPPSGSSQSFLGVFQLIAFSVALQCIYSFVRLVPQQEAVFKGHYLPPQLGLQQQLNRQMFHFPLKLKKELHSLRQQKTPHQYHFCQNAKCLHTPLAADLKTSQKFRTFLRLPAFHVAK